MLAALSPRDAHIWRVKAATEVFPLVPVTAAVVAGWRGKNAAAASASARRTCGTTIIATPGGTSAARSAMTAAAPFASACGTKASPSALVPGAATHRQTAVTLRLSEAMNVSSRPAKRGSKRASVNGRTDNLLAPFRLSPFVPAQAWIRRHTALHYWI